MSEYTTNLVKLQNKMLAARDEYKVPKMDIMDIIQFHQAIYTHPNNVPLLKTKFEEQSEQYGSYIASIRPIQIIENRNLEECKYEWVRGEELPDCRFYTLVDDLKNPPSWAIFFGLVKQVKGPPIFYLVNNKAFTVKQWR